jgi:hypothetical protein
MAIYSIALGAVTVVQLPCRFLFMAHVSQYSISKHNTAYQQQGNFSEKCKYECRNQKVHAENKNSHIIPPSFSFHHPWKA